MSTFPSTIRGDRYTIEPGVGECRAHLDPWGGGGIGSATPIATKYYDYQGTPSEVSLQAFLDIMDYVDDDVRFYWTKDLYAVDDFMDEYLEHYLDYSTAREIKQAIDNHLWRRDHRESGFKSNIVVGTPFFNDIFYETGWKVACSLIPGAAFNEFHMCWGMDPRVNHFPVNKWMVNMFDARESYSYMDTGFGKYSISGSMLNETLVYCTERDWEQGIAPLIYFLSNWTLLLASYLAMHVFGQCAFGIYWETGYRSR